MRARRKTGQSSQGARARCKRRTMKSVRGKRWNMKSAADSFGPRCSRTRGVSQAQGITADTSRWTDGCTTLYVVHFVGLYGTDESGAHSLSPSRPRLPDEAQTRLKRTSRREHPAATLPRTKTILTST